MQIQFELLLYHISPTYETPKAPNLVGISWNQIERVPISQKMGTQIRVIYVCDPRLSYVPAK